MAASLGQKPSYGASWDFRTAKTAEFCGPGTTWPGRVVVLLAMPHDAMSAKVPTNRTAERALMHAQNASDRELLGRVLSGSTHLIDLGLCHRLAEILWRHLIGCFISSERILGNADSSV